MAEQLRNKQTCTIVRCGKCGSREVDICAWISPNLDNSFSMYYDGTSLEESETCYCHECREWTKPVFEQVEITHEEPYRCTNCGSTNVQRKVWARPNNNNEYVDDVGEDETHEEDCWCEDCEEHYEIKPHHEFMEDIEHCFFMTCKRMIGCSSPDCVNPIIRQKRLMRLRSPHIGTF